MIHTLFAIHDNREGFIHCLLFMTIENDSYIVLGAFHSLHESIYSLYPAPSPFIITTTTTTTTTTITTTTTTTVNTIIIIIINGIILVNIS